MSSRIASRNASSLDLFRAAAWRPRAARCAGPHGAIRSSRSPSRSAWRRSISRRLDRHPRRSRPRARHGDHLGRGRADLGGLPDRRGARRRPAPIAALGGHPPLGDPELHRSRRTVCATTTASRPRSTAFSRPRSPLPSASPPSGGCTASPGSTSGRRKPTAEDALGLGAVLPDWFYAAVLDDALILTIDRAIYRSHGRYRTLALPARAQHGGRQEFGWSFDHPPHAKSGSLSPLKHFAYDLRAISSAARHCPVTG